MTRFWFIDTVMKMVTTVVVFFVLATESPTFMTATVLWIIPLPYALGIMACIWTIEPIISFIIEARKGSVEIE